MNVKVGTLLDSPVVISRLAGEQIVQARTRYRIKRLLKAVTEEAEPARAEWLQLYKTYGKELEGGGYRVTPENWDKFSAELKTLMETISDTTLMPLTASELEAAGIKLSVAEETALAELYTYDLPEEQK